MGHVNSARWAKPIHPDQAVWWVWSPTDGRRLVPKQTSKSAPIRRLYFRHLCFATYISPTSVWHGRKGSLYSVPQYILTRQGWRTAIGTYLLSKILARSWCAECIRLKSQWVWALVRIRSAAYRCGYLAMYGRCARWQKLDSMTRNIEAFVIFLPQRVRLPVFYSIQNVQKV